MTNLDQESLFSLELIVDQLCLHQSVECRIPAVAFRLLDFPTLLIYHVDPELTATIRSKLLSDHYQSVPAQLKELKDRKTGAFLIRRGKSCLFRVSPNTVVSSLSSAPLYVMVVDMFPERPKLVGSCGLPLSACVRDLYSDIVTSGIAVPAVQAEKKELDLCNLMGTKLGRIVLGCRLLSLGAALLSHIPTHNVIRIKPEEEINQYFFPATDEVLHSIPEARIAASQSKNARSDNSDVEKIVEKTFADSQTQIELPSFGSVGTQTSRMRTHSPKPITPLANDVDDAVTTNIVCPPLLFYNSTVCKKTVCWRQEDWSSVWQMADDGSNWSDDETIRVEEKCLDADIEATRSVVENKLSPRAESKSVLRSDSATKTPYHPDNITEFPILSALMAEILRFHGLNFVPDNNGVDASHEVRYKIQKAKTLSTLQKVNAVKVVEPKRFAHRCANMPSRGKDLTAPRRRSSEPVVHQKPLFAGMTNTQRLRLARVNPKLLQELETKEMRRRSEFRAARLGRRREKENVPTDNQKSVDEIDSLKSRPIDGSRTTEYVDESRESSAQYKCPVPTPRLSKMFLADTDFADTATKTYTVGRNRMEARPLQQSSSEENFEFTLRPMKVDIESAVTDDSIRCRQSAAALTSDTADSKSSDMQAATHLKLNIVGSDYSDVVQRPSVSAPAMCGDAPAGTAQLEATTAEGLLSLEDLGLRKIVDHYSGSSDDDGDDKTERSYDDKELKDRDSEYYSAEGEDNSVVSEKHVEPEQLLRKVVNQYSDGSDVEEHDLEYEYDFEDTPAQSLMTVSPINSSTSSILDSTVHRRILSPTAGSNVKITGQSGLSSRTDESRHDVSVPLTDRSMSLGGETYSEAFETVSEDELVDAKPVREAKLLPSAQLGYTWA